MEWRAIWLAAHIYLKTSEEGGMSKPGWSGMMPSFNINGDPIMCAIYAMYGAEEIPLGIEQEAWINLPYGGIYKDHVVEGAKFLLQIGGHFIGWGTVLSLND